MSTDIEAAAQLRCCAHEIACAVHEQPYDGQYVACTCALATGSIRHRHTYRRSPPREPEKDHSPQP